ncbi:MAG TPA: 16S rRNA (guanine(966)-N(2))-methyltransferase RsmD [Thermodesulfovibrionales bacterium]|nr:16S rRNA (guanine(966)-N(2))-methyltransferase RsmD [Thermodesulfovibrionales bacterium]
MRISAGVAKGRRIGFKKAFLTKDDGDELRPTSSKVREALFDIVRNSLPGAAFLDLYAGTGGVGMEALSRGAAKVVFVESSRVRARMIERLASEFNFAQQAAVLSMSVRDFIREEAEEGKRYDIVFLDPPYHSGELMEVLPLIGEGNILEEGSLVIAEHFFKTRLPDTIEGLGLIKSYKYGDTVLTVYRITRRV